MGLPGRDTIGTLEPPLVRRSACNDVETALGSSAMMERTQSIETGQGPIAFGSREGVAEPVRFATPKGASASAMALAMAGKAAMAPASPQPFTPSGLVVQRVPMKPEVEGGEVVGAGHRVIHKPAGDYRAFIPLARWALHPQRRRPCRRRRIFTRLAAKSLPCG